VPESKSRKKKVAPGDPAAPRPVKAEGNPRWLVPTMLGLMILGLVWIVTYYLTSSDLGLPIPPLGTWNLAVGFALVIAGFGLTTRWR
jgi:hypothetical protein